MAAEEMAVQEVMPAAPPAEIAEPAATTGAASERGDRRRVRWVTWLALLPTPLWFAIAALRDAGPVWRAEYHGSRDLSGAGVVVSERRLSRYWDREHPSAPGGFDAREISARFDTCLRLSEARDVPFLLVAKGSARFWIDGQERLRVDEDSNRVTRGASLRLEPGLHHLRVEFVGRPWPSIALDASFDGHAPVAVPSERSAAGVRWALPRGKDAACAE